MVVITKRLLRLLGSYCRLQTPNGVRTSEAKRSECNFHGRVDGVSLIMSFIYLSTFVMLCHTLPSNDWSLILHTLRALIRIPLAGLWLFVVLTFCRMRVSCAPFI